ncbi:MAG: hypothetical protein AB7I19_05065 [Planctomycetota bacterium]
MSLKEQAEFGGDFQVLLVEAQGHSMAEVEKFALERGWLGNAAMWTTQRPFATHGRGIPHAALLDVDGRVILEGNPLAMAKDFKTAIAAQIALRKKGPPSLAKELRPVWRDRVQGKFADAIAEATRLAEGGGEHAEAASAEAAAARAAGDAAVARIHRLMEQGRYAHASDLLRNLEKGAKGDEALEQSAAELRQRLDSEELETELDAEKSILKLERLLLEKGAEAVPAKAVKKFLDKHADTKAAARAQHLLTLLGTRG